MHNVTGIRNLTRLRVGFSPLNEHRFRHNFDCPSPLCACGVGNEDNEHFLLHCPLFANARRDLLGQLRDIPLLDFSVLDNEALSNLLLFGDDKLNIVSNRFCYFIGFVLFLYAFCSFCSVFFVKYFLKLIVAL